MTNSKKAKRFQFWINVVLLLITLSIVLPFVLVFISSLTDENTLIRNGYSFFPEKFSFYAYSYIIRQGEKILRAYGITVFVTIVGTAANIAMSSLLAYPLSVKKPAVPQSNYLFRILYDAVQRRTGADLPDVCKLSSYQKHDLGIDCSGLPVKCKQRADDPKLL
mgnify:CR=1 FL=1